MTSTAGALYLAHEQQQLEPLAPAKPVQVTAPLIEFVLPHLGVQAIADFVRWARSLPTGREKAA